MDRLEREQACGRAAASGLRGLVALGGLLALGACSSSSGRGGTPPLCQEGDWTLSATVIGDGGACIDLALDGATVTLYAVPTEQPPTGVPLQGFGVSTDSFEVVDPPEGPSLAVFLSTFDPNPADGDDGEVDLMGFTGVYYLPAVDATVTVETGPSPEQFPQVTADCETFTTFARFTAYAGRWLETWPAGVAPELCSGEVLLQGTRAGNPALPATAAEIPLIGILELEGARERILLNGFADPAMSRAVLVSLAQDRVELELRSTGPDRYSAVGRFADARGASRLGGTLLGNAEQLAGVVRLEPAGGRPGRAVLLVQPAAAERPLARTAGR